MKRTNFLLSLPFLFLSACSNTLRSTVADSSSTSLTGTYWKLVELNGKPVGEPDEGKRREIFLTLSVKENRVSGNAGCNDFGGTYKPGAEGLRLQFSGIIRTEMACEGLDLESEYFAVIERSDSYYIVNDTLQLNSARVAPLARFVAIPSKVPSVK